MFLDFTGLGAVEFKDFDRRKYPTVSVAAGYGEWAATYEATVPDQLDIRVLENLTSHLSATQQCLDLACGTGRIGAWLKAKGLSSIDGLDITPEMLDRARERRLYRRLYLGSVDDSGIEGGNYDLLTMSLVDEHLPSLGPVYREAFRLSAAGGKFVVVGMHPFFFMNGMPTHFKDVHGNTKAIETHVHLMSDHVKAAFAAGWCLVEMHEGVIDEEWIRVKPKWEPLKHVPVNFGYVWGRV